MIEKQPLGLAHELAALADAPAPHRGPQCSVGILLKAAGPDVAASLRAVLETTSVSATAIAETLSRYGTTVTAYTVNRHRRRGKPNGCRCER
ncbi:hypothetical protein ACIP93_33290 [Streptomyces sp. NPDC088745]|uniref:hypothetical protein n=1 Tax=Streptomyces sp. NPDC088745 TaxID=3365884 RepID=UPI00380124C4